VDVDDLDRHRQLVGIDPDEHLHAHWPFLAGSTGDREAGIATTSWAVPSGATPRHGARRVRKPIESHTHIAWVGSREESVPPNAWTESGRTPILKGII
jgi:hypothetical protein